MSATTVLISTASLEQDSKSSRKYNVMLQNLSVELQVKQIFRTFKAGSLLFPQSASVRIRRISLQGALDLKRHCEAINSKE